MELIISEVDNRENTPVELPEPQDTAHAVYLGLYNNNQYDSYFSMSNVEIIKLVKQEKVELLKRKIKKCLELEYQLGPKNPVLQNINKLEKDLKTKLQVKIAKQHNNGYLWVTINPDEKKIKFSEFKKKIIKISKKTCFEECIFVFEQRGTSKKDMGKGFHTHMLIKRNLKYKPVKLKQNIQKSCEKFTYNSKNQNYVNLQIIGEEFAKDKLDYILGLKTGLKKSGEKKSEAQKYDTLWRIKNNIEIYYGSLTL